MPQSLAHLPIHIIFSTKHREPFLAAADLRRKLHVYLAGTLKSLDSPSIVTGGVSDHVHILCLLSRKVAVADLVEETKKGSSKWVKAQPGGARDFYWQGGYAAFAVSASNTPRVERYIAGQERHHRRMSLQDELRSILRKHGVAFDERYVWD